MQMNVNHSFSLKFTGVMFWVDTYDRRPSVGPFIGAWPWTMLCIKSPAELLSSIAQVILVAYIINWSVTAETFRVTSQTSLNWTRHDHVMISWTEEQAAFFKTWVNKSDKLLFETSALVFWTTVWPLCSHSYKKLLHVKSPFTLHALLIHSSSS